MKVFGKLWLTAVNRRVKTKSKILQKDEKMTFRSYSTFMKLHGWEMLDDVQKSQTLEKSAKSNEPKRKWLIGNLSSTQAFTPVLPPNQNASWTNQLTKFKKEANFADLQNLTGNGYKRLF